jgi:F-type H+-transporting ATPase subunit b
VLIDWFTVGAQAVNFAILAWLLKRLLYKPILEAIDAREKRVAKELADADAARSAAQGERAEFGRKSAELEAQRAEFMSRAMQQAKAEGQRLLDQARQAADELSARRREALRVDAQNLDGELGRRAQREVFAIVRKVLGDLATASLEQCMTAEFIRRLRELRGPARAALIEALVKGGEPVLIRTAFELPAAELGGIRQALTDLGAPPERLRFEITPELVGGIELTTHGQKLAWSIAEYLRSLEQSVGEVIAEQMKAPVAAAPAAAAGPSP